MNDAKRILIENDKLQRALAEALSLMESLAAKERLCLSTLEAINKVYSKYGVGKEEKEK
jgi:hypothetical protein